MAGKKRDDKSPRARNVIQVCVDDGLLESLVEDAKHFHDGKVSVAARSVLQEHYAAAA